MISEVQVVTRRFAEPVGKLVPAIMELREPVGDGLEVHEYVNTRVHGGTRG